MAQVLKVALILIRDRKVLYAQTKGEEMFYNVGGQPEVGEGDIDALVREVREETGTAVWQPSIKYLRSFSAKAHGDTNKKVLIRCYRADVEGEPNASAEVEELAWFTSADRARTTEAGARILDWLLEEKFVD